MQHSAIRCNRYTVEVFECAADGQVSQDAALVRATGQGIRLAAIDGCTPMRESRPAAGVDAAVWASGVLLTALRSNERAERCLRAANRALHDPSQPIGQAQRQAAAVIADIHDATPGVVELVRAMDCEAWVFDGRAWSRAFCTPRLKRAPLAAFERWLEAHPDATHREHQQAEESHFGARESWQVTSVGRFETPLLESAVLRGVERLVLASDGARLDGERVANLPQWLAQLRAFERAHPPKFSRKLHDDVTVLSVDLRA